MAAYKQRAKQIVINRTPNKLGFPKKYSLSDFAFGDIYYDQPPVESSFIRIDEKRGIVYSKYTELLKKNRVKVKIRKK